MKRMFTPNIDRKGRIVRGVFGLALFAGAAVCFDVSPWLGALLAVSGLFALVEALRGWCLARACGIKTRI